MESQPVASSAVPETSSVPERRHPAADSILAPCRVAELARERTRAEQALTAFWVQLTVRAMGCAS